MNQEQAKNQGGMTAQQYLVGWAAAVQRTMALMAKLGLSEEEARSVISFTVVMSLTPQLVRMGSPSNEAAAQVLGGVLTDAANMAKQLRARIVVPRIVVPPGARN